MQDQLKRSDPSDDGQSPKRDADRSLWSRWYDRGRHLLASELYPRLGCSVAISSVVGRRKIGEIDRSHIRDFGLGFPTPARSLDLRTFAPYFADYRRETLHLARMDPRRDSSRAFFYMAQREFADQVAAVRFDRLEALYDPGFVRAATPLLVFSIGRCGSTLLSELILESGLHAFSEPDIFSQTAELCGETGRRLGHSAEKTRAIREKVLGVMLASLYARAGGPGVCVKMRSGAAAAFREILEVYPGADSVFLFRGVESWARSWITAFEARTDLMVATLTRCVTALDVAHEAGLAHRVAWYEEILADPEATCRRILGEAAGSGDLRSVMASDSQKSTRLSTTRLDRRRADEAERIATGLEAFLRVWREAQPKALLRKHGLDGLLA